MALIKANGVVIYTGRVCKANADMSNIKAFHVPQFIFDHKNNSTRREIAQREKRELKLLEKLRLLAIAK